MAQKKKLNPMATALTIAAVGVTGWILWKFVINPRRKKLKQESMGVDLPIDQSEIFDAQFEIIDNDQQA
jgi:peptidoglycan/LPS O-acetylase OafA/YrhL